MLIKIVRIEFYKLKKKKSLMSKIAESFDP